MRCYKASHQDENQVLNPFPPNWRKWESRDVLSEAAAFRRGSVHVNSTYFFYRSDICCLLAEDENDCWMGFVGLSKDHPVFDSRFHKCDTGVALYKYNLTSEALDTTNESWLKLWWMGYQTDPYSKEKTLEKLKEIADELGTPEEDDLHDPFSGMFYI